MAPNVLALSRLFVLSALILVSGCKTLDDAVAKIDGGNPEEPSGQQALDATPVSLDQCSRVIARVNIDQDVSFVGRRNQDQYAHSLNSKIVENILRKSRCFRLVRKHQEYELEFVVVPSKRDYSDAGSLLGMAGIIAAPVTMGFTGLMAIGVAPAVAGMSVAKMDVDVGVEIIRQADGHYTNIEHKSVAGDDYYYSELLFSDSGSGAEWEASEDGKRILAAIIPAVNKTISWIRTDKGISPNVLTGQWSNSSREEVRLVQARLKELGFDPGPIDGIMGSKTRTAIQDFQRSQDIPPDGRITSELHTKLGI